MKLLKETSERPIEAEEQYAAEAEVVQA